MGLFFNKKKPASSAPLPAQPKSKVRPYSGELYSVTELPASAFFKSNGIRLKKVDCYIRCYIAIDESDNLWCWGNENSDVSEFMKGRKSTKPIKILDEVKEVFIPTKLVLRNDGSLWKWDGFGYQRNWGNEVSLRFGDDNWILIARDVADVSGRFYVDTSGNLFGSGHNRHYTLDSSIDEEDEIRNPKLIMRDVSKAKDFGIGYEVGVLKRDASLWMWGWNYKGQIGNGSTDDQRTPYKVLSGVIDFFETGYTSAAIKTDNTLWSWGDNEDGKVGNGSFKPQLTPVKILDSVSEFLYDEGSISPYHGALLNDHSLWFWGNNGAGRFMCEPNTGSTETYLRPTKVLDNVKKCVSFGGHMAAIKTDGTMVIWGGFGCHDVDSSYSSRRFAPQKVLTDVVQIGAVWNSACYAVKSDGSIWYIFDKSYREYFDRLR